MRRIVRTKGFDATDCDFVLLAALLLPSTKERVGVLRRQRGRFRGIRTDHRESGGGVAGCASSAIAMETVVETSY